MRRATLDPARRLVRVVRFHFPGRAADGLQLPALTTHRVRSSRTTLSQQAGPTVRRWATVGLWRPSRSWSALVGPAIISPALVTWAVWTTGGPGPIESRPRTVRRSFPTCASGRTVPSWASRRTVLAGTSGSTVAWRSIGRTLPTWCRAGGASIALSTGRTSAVTGGPGSGRGIILTGTLRSGSADRSVGGLAGWPIGCESPTNLREPLATDCLESTLCRRCSRGVIRTTDRRFALTGGGHGNVVPGLFARFRGRYGLGRPVAWSGSRVLGPSSRPCAGALHDRAERRSRRWRRDRAGRSCWAERSAEPGTRLIQAIRPSRSLGPTRPISSSRLSGRSRSTGAFWSLGSPLRTLVRAGRRRWPERSARARAGQSRAVGPVRLAGPVASACRGLSPGCSGSLRHHPGTALARSAPARLLSTD